MEAIDRRSVAKVNGNGKAATLTAEQLDELLVSAPSPLYRALWSLQRWSASRVTEALALEWGSLKGGLVTYKRATTKTKTTKQVRCCKRLVEALEVYRAAWTEEHGYEPADRDLLFPSATDSTKPLSRQSADKALRKATAALGLEGVSTHTFRRSFATSAVRRGVGLDAIRKVTGHKDLQGLTPYIEVDEADVMAALEAA